MRSISKASTSASITPEKPVAGFRFDGVSVADHHHAPLHPQTYHLFDAELINSMRRGSYIVNTARAEIVVRDAIVDALESGQLAGYAGDVWYPQPPAADHPWRTMPYEAMTPHVSGTTLSAQARYAAGTREILEDFLAGRDIRSSRAASWPAPGRSPIPPDRPTAARSCTGIGPAPEYVGSRAFFVTPKRECIACSRSRCANRPRRG
jgi:hypothetical protein